MLKNTLLGLGLLLANTFSSTMVSAQETILNSTVSSAEVDSFVADLGLADALSDQLYSALEAESLIVDGEGTATATTLTERSTATQTAAAISKALLSVACAISKFKFGSKYSTSGTTNYQTLVEINWSQACWESSQCIISPTNTAEVATAIKIITFLRVPFAVRSGGHSPNPGFASSDSAGILLDLSKLTEITLSTDKATARIGPGNRWVDVYTALDPSGVQVVGGRIPSVGVGGLILGGGLSFLTGEHGFACDNVKSFEVVLASGSVVTASASSNSDLFWALKGGANNFGVVTSFELYTHPSDTIYYEALLFPHTLVDSLLAAIETYQTDLEPTNPKAALSISATLEGFTVLLVYTAGVSRPAVFDGFYAISGSATIIPATVAGYSTLVQTLAIAFTADPMRHDYRAISSGVSADLYKQVYTFWHAAATDLRASTGANMTYSLQTISKNMVTAGDARGGNAMGLTAEPQQWFTMVVDWTDPADDVTVRAAAKSVTDKWVSLTKGTDLENGFVYLNDASRDQNPVKSYGDASVKKLKAAAKKYDPLEVFQRLQEDGFLLRKL
ncbi:hypothetical protein EDC01DRAFT_706766 [Geopyxis carbonaria]|nr:hypothetical protein EDC01DRAFT_706766 [Geopyxis carbonaria]